MLTAYDSNDLLQVATVARQLEETRETLKSRGLDPKQRLARQRCYDIQLVTLHRAVARVEQTEGGEEE